MDTQRLVLFVVFSFSLLMLWEAYQKQMHPPVPTQVQQQADVPAGVPAGTPGQAAAGKAGQAAGQGVPGAAASATPAAPAAPRQRIHVETDLVIADIDTQGGDVVHLELKKYPDTTDQTKNLVLFGPEYAYSMQSGLIGEGLPNHRTVYRTDIKEAKLVDGQDTVDVRLEADGTGAAAGAKVAKILRFHRGSYLVDVIHEVKNDGAAPVAAQAYYHIVRDHKQPPGDTMTISTYTGPAIYTDEDKFHKIPFTDIDKAQDRRVPERNADNGWVAMVQHYFVSALLPAEKGPRTMYAEHLGGDLYRVGMKLPVGPVAPGAEAVTSVRLYAGPEEQDNLRTIAPGLERVVDYGYLTIISQPLFWVLEFFHKLIGNWGAAIILLTFSIKLIFFPLSAAGYRSMAKMKAVAPRIAKMKEQYPDDRMKQNQAMMEMYKTEKINPLGGCLPMVVQIPVFISLYWTLLASVELRHAPFVGWIHDLSAPDPWYVLPALMMLSMIIQTRLQPTPPDPVQAKVMMIMPLAFGVMFFFFPAGLVLYWVVNNVLSILQQWQITRMIERGQKNKTAVAKR